MIAVTFALPAESSDFIKLVQNPIQGRIGEAEFTCGSISEARVCVLHTGVGGKVARPRVQQFLEHQRPDLLISAGFAGALSDELHVGDLLLVENFSAPDRFASATRLLGERTRRGKMATAGAIVDGRAERTRLRDQTGAVAVDMETEFIAAACRAAGVPLISLRAISDTPVAPLPAPANVLFDVARQKTSFTALARYVARHPSTLWSLIRFAARIGRARASLTRALVALVAQHQPETSADAAPAATAG